MSVKQNEVANGCFFAFVIVAAWVTITATVCVVAGAQDSAEPAYVPIEKRVKPDKPQPDKKPGKGEAVIVDPDFGELVVEGREEHEARKKKRLEELKQKHLEQERQAEAKEKLRREQEEYDRLHPKPAAPTGLLGFVWSWIVGPTLTLMFGSVAWFFTLSKWALFFFLLILLVLLGTVIVFFGSAAVVACRWLGSKIAAMWSRKK